MAFRIATFNLHQGYKRWEERRRLIVEQFGVLRPDILALNEVSVPLQTGRWLWREVNERYNSKYSYIQQNKTGAFISEEEAQGILTRFPVLEACHSRTEYIAHVGDPGLLERRGVVVHHSPVDSMAYTALLWTGPSSEE